MNPWVFDLESMIFSRVKYATEEMLKRKYPNIRYTVTDKPIDSTTRFPTVYIHELSSMEQGMDLDNTEINAILYTIQLEVITNKSQAEAKAVMAALASAMKTMRFTFLAFPDFNNGNSYYRCVARAQRMIGAADIL